MIALQTLSIVAGMVCFSYALSLLYKNKGSDGLGKTKGSTGKPST